MSLLVGLNIINNYIKKSKKSIHRFGENIRQIALNILHKLKKQVKLGLSRLAIFKRFDSFWISFHKYILKSNIKSVYISISRILKQIPPVIGIFLGFINSLKSAFVKMVRFFRQVYQSVRSIHQKFRESIYRAFGNTPQIRIDLLIIIVLFFLIASPFIADVFSEKEREIEVKQVILFLSPRCEELLGKEITEKLLQEFNELNGEVIIRLADPLDEREPDILLFDDGEFSVFTAGSSLVELSSFTNYDSGGQQLAIPLVSFMDFLFYNIDILAAAGFDSPPKTREEFLAYARVVSDGRFPGVSGAAMSLNSGDSYSLSRDVFSWLWAAGSDFPSGGDGIVLNPRTAANDITFFGSLYREGLLATRVFESTGEQRLEEFAQGRIAMMIASSRAIPYLRQRMGDSAFGITTIPDPATGGRYNINISAIYAGINITCEYPDEAWRFLEFITEKSSFLCSELNAVPGIVTSIIPGDYIEGDPFYIKAWDIFESAWIIDGFSGNPNAREYERSFLEELRVFFTTSRTAQQTVTAIQQRWDEVGRDRSF